MKRLLLILILLTHTIFGYCCKCEEPNSVLQEMDASDIVVYGKVISIEKVSPAQTIDTSRLHRIPLRATIFADKTSDYLYQPAILAVKLEVLKGFKGARAGQILTVFTPMSGASCGYTDFKIGELFVVYGGIHAFYLEWLFKNYNDYKKLELANTFWTSDCTRTTDYVADELAKLNGLRR